MTTLKLEGGFYLSGGKRCHEEPEDDGLADEDGQLPNSDSSEDSHEV